MSFDLRIPIGLMFSLYGILLTAYGLFGNAEYNKRSLGINIDMTWGLFLLFFGVVMLFFAWNGAKKQVEESKGKSDKK